MFGRLSGGYSSSLTGNLLAGLAGLLFSPSRGLLVYSPVLLFLAPAVWLWRRARRGRVVGACALFAAAHVLVHAVWPIWWGGDCFGPRLLAETLPGLVLLLVPLLEWLERIRLARVAFIALAAFSVFVQFVGAFCYPKGDWHARPVSVSHHLERLWDWRDNPIRRDLSAGVELKGYAVLAELVTALREGRPPALEKVGLHVQ